MTPVTGEQLVVPSGLPRTLEAALQRYGTSSFKAPMATVLDPNGKMTTTLTYGKLLSRAMKIAYALSTKVFSKGPRINHPKTWRYRSTGLPEQRSAKFHHSLVWLHVSWSRSIAHRIAIVIVRFTTTTGRISVELLWYSGGIDFRSLPKGTAQMYYRRNCKAQGLATFAVVRH